MSLVLFNRILFIRNPNTQALELTIPLGRSGESLIARRLVIVNSSNNNIVEDAILRNDEIGSINFKFFCHDEEQYETLRQLISQFQERIHTH